jgi:hypothetical protein
MKGKRKLYAFIAIPLSVLTIYRSYAYSFALEYTYGLKIGEIEGSLLTSG